MPGLKTVVAEPDGAEIYSMNEANITYLNDTTIANLDFSIMTEHTTEAWEDFFVKFLGPSIIFYVEFINSAYLACLTHQLHYNTIIRQMNEDIDLKYYDIILDSTKQDLESIYNIMENESILAYDRIKKFKSLLKLYTDLSKEQDIYLESQYEFLKEKEENVIECYYNIQKNTITLKNRNDKNRLFTKAYEEVEVDLEYYNKIKDSFYNH